MKILVVDDDQEVGVLLGLALRRLGHSPLLAVHPDDALAMLTPDIDAVITDIDMPVMSGVDLARVIRDSGTDIPIAFCTGSDPAGQTVAEAAAIGRVMPKIWTSEQVEELVAYLAAGARGTGREQRAMPRYRTRLAVRYESAQEYKREYTGNLSRGGLFVRNDEGLAPLQEVDVTLELPGLGEFELGARVAYVVSRKDAASTGATPGAGLSITKAPPGFQSALQRYLHRLERRWDYVVLASDEQFRRVFAMAGYRALAAPPPAELAEAFASAEAPVVGVVVSRRDEQAYAAVADPAMVHSVDYVEELDLLLQRFDTSIDE